MEIIEFEIQENKNTGRKYIMEPREAKDRDTKKKEVEYSMIHIMDREEANPDPKFYKEDLQKKAEHLLEPFLGKDTKRSLKVNDLCRARIVAASFKDITNPKVGLTMRQTGLGKLEWVDEDLNKKGGKAAAKEDKK